MFAEVLWPAAFVKVDGFAGGLQWRNTIPDLAEASVVERVHAPRVDLSDHRSRVQRTAAGWRPPD